MDNISGRRSTDLRISRAWVAVAIPGVVATGGIYFFALLSVFFNVSTSSENDPVYWFVVYGRGLGILVFGILFAILAFKLINRLNLHTGREQKLRAATMALLRGRSGPGSEEPEIMDQIIALSAFDGQALVYEKRLDASRWALGIAALLIVEGLATFLQYWSIVRLGSNFNLFGLEVVLSLVASVMSLAALVVLLMLANHLMKTIYTHGVRWRGFANSTAIAMRRLGFAFDPPSEGRPVRERSIVLYAVLTILTLGLFGFYWLFVLIDDPRIHFEEQWPFENALSRALSK